MLNFPTYLISILITILVILLIQNYDSDIEIHKKTFNKQLVDSLVTENVFSEMKNGSLETMRYEIDSLRQEVYDCNRLLLTIYDFAVPEDMNRYKLIECKTTDEIDSIYTEEIYELEIKEHFENFFDKIKNCQ